MFNLAIDSKMRDFDLVNLRIRDISHGEQILPRAMVIQRKTQRPVQFELTEPTRAGVAAWLETAHLRGGDQYFFLSGVKASVRHLEQFSLLSISRMLNRQNAVSDVALLVVDDLYVDGMHCERTFGVENKCLGHCTRARSWRTAPGV